MTLLASVPLTNERREALREGELVVVVRGDVLERVSRADDGAQRAPA